MESGGRTKAEQKLKQNEMKSDKDNKEEVDEEKGTKKQKDILRHLQRDPSKVKFLRDLVAYKNKIIAKEKEIQRQREEGEGLISEKSNEPQSQLGSLGHPGIIHLTKTALRGKYGDHVRKSIRHRDFPSLKCLLALNPIQNEPHMPSRKENQEKKEDDKNPTESKDKQIHRKTVQPHVHGQSSGAAANVLGMMMYELFKNQLHISYDKILDFCIPRLPSEFEDFSTPKPSNSLVKFEGSDAGSKSKLQEVIRCFHRNMKAILELTKDSQLEHFEGGSSQDRNCQKAVLNFKHFWIQEFFHVQALNQMIREIRDLHTRREKRISDLDSEIESLLHEIEFAKRENVQLVRDEVKTGEIEKLTTEKMDSKSSAQIDLETSQTMTNRIQVMLKQCKFEEDTRQKKLDLENELDAIIVKYDAKLNSGQKYLDNVDLEIKANEEILDELKKKYEEIDVRYDDMTRSIKLRQLLKNMEMAEGFKRNRAARIIQAVWRRYKLRQYKKAKKKLRLRRKAGAGTPGGRRSVGDKTKDSSSEAGGKGSSTRSGSTIPALPPMKPKAKSKPMKRSTSELSMTAVAQSKKTEAKIKGTKPKAGGGGKSATPVK